MLRGTLKGDSCETGDGNLPGPCSDILMKQRRGSAYYKNNPLQVLNNKYNTFSNTPLGGSINYNIPGYEDAPGTNVTTQDINLPELKKELIGGKNKYSKITSGIVRGIIDGKSPVISASPLAGIESKENFIGLIRRRRNNRSIFPSFFTLLMILLIVYFAYKLFKK